MQTPRVLPVRVFLLGILIALALLLPSAPCLSSGTCEPQWARGMFPIPGCMFGVNNSTWSIRAFCVLKDELYVGGDFGYIGSHSAYSCAKWDGVSWKPVGTPTYARNDIWAMCVYEGELYAAGYVHTKSGEWARVVRLNGIDWESVSQGFEGPVASLCVYNGELYAGGSFSIATPQPAANVAKWDGQAWSPVGGGVGGPVTALCVHEGELYAGAKLASSDGASARAIVRWNGESWRPYGEAIVDDVLAMCTYAGELYVGAGRSVVRWDGNSWQPLGTLWGPTRSLCAYNGELYAAGTSVDSWGVGRWNGSWWQPPPGSPANAVTALFVHSGRLIVGGMTALLTSWDGNAWRSIGPGIDKSVASLQVYKRELYAGGRMTTADGSSARGIARWNGSCWKSVDSGVVGNVSALCVHGDELWAGGNFTAAGGQAANHIARWDGAAWGLAGSGLNSSVLALCSHNGELVAGGYFTSAGGLPADHIARWDGSSWHAIGSGVAGSVKALCVYDGELYAGTLSGTVTRWDGVGWQTVGEADNEIRSLCVYRGELYAGGSFTNMSGVGAVYTARWDGFCWRAVGSGWSKDQWDMWGVNALLVHDNELYAAGLFSASAADGATASCIARWNGDSWQRVAKGTGSDVFGLCEYDDGLGSEPALYVGGSFLQAGGNISRYMARWGCEDAATDVSSAKCAAVGTLVSLSQSGQVSTAVFGDAFYTSSTGSGSQVSGIRSEMPYHGITPGKLTAVTGRTRTNADGECYIQAWSATCGEDAAISPLLMPLASLGGGPLGLQSGVWGWRAVQDDGGGFTREWGLSSGLNNIGMLVRVCGRITSVTDDRNFTIDDGSGLNVHCVMPAGAAVDPLWQYVAITGISSCERVGDELHRKLLVRSAEDVQAVEFPECMTLQHCTR